MPDKRSDERAFERKKGLLPFQVSVRSSKNPKTVFENPALKNISGGGAFFYGESPAVNDSEVVISLTIPFETRNVLDSKKLTVSIEGKVKRCEKDGFAVQFENQGELEM